MKLTINRESLLPVLEKTQGVLENKSTSPVLSNLLISASEKGLRLTGTDLDTEISGYIDNTGIERYGSVTAPAKKLLDICKSLPQDSLLELELTGNTLTLVSMRSIFKLSTLPPDDFPVLDSISFDHSIRLKEALFSNVISQTGYAMAQHDVRYYLNGMLLTQQDGRITTVATDGHRLACCSVAITDISTDSNLSIIIPRKGVHELARLLSEKSEQEIELQISDNHIRLQKENVRFTSKLIDGKYPDYEAAIPANTKHTIELDRAQIKESLSRVAILSNDKFRGVLLKLSEGTLTIRSNNPERETAEETIDLNYSGDDFEVGFNVSYLLDAINNLSGDSITFALNNVESSSLITSPDNPESISVVMPVRL